MASADEVSVPEELSGGYGRIEPEDVTEGMTVAVLYASQNGRNYLTGRVAAVETTGRGPRVVVVDTPDRQLERLIVDPPAGESGSSQVRAETVARTTTRGRLLALYARA